MIKFRAGFCELLATDKMRILSD